MAKRKVRTIVVAGASYAWRATTRRLRGESGVRGEGCVRVFPADHPRSVLDIRFADEPGWYVGDFADGEVRWHAGDRAWNLHRPAVARALIEGALAAGWRPADGRPAELTNGLELLVLSGAPTGG